MLSQFIKILELILYRILNWGYYTDYRSSKNKILRFIETPFFSPCIEILICLFIEVSFKIMTEVSVETILKYFIENKYLFAFNTSRLMLFYFVLLLNITFNSFLFSN